MRAKLEQGEADTAPKELKPIQPQSHTPKPQFDHIDTLLGLALMNADARPLFAETNPALFAGDHRQALLITGSYFVAGLWALRGVQAARGLRAARRFALAEQAA